MVTEPDEQWMLPYVAGAFDWDGMLRARVKEQSTNRFGYGFSFEVRFEKTSKPAIGLVDDFCQQVGVQPTLRVQEKEDSEDRFRASIGSRADIETFLEAVGPFLVIRYEQAEILLEGVFPALEEGRHRTQEGFVEVVELLDEFHEASFQRGSGHVKYDADYFRDEFDLNE